MQVDPRPRAHAVAVHALIAARQRLHRHSARRDLLVVPMSDESDGWRSAPVERVDGAHAQLHGEDYQPHAPVGEREVMHQELLLFVQPWPRARPILQAADAHAQQQHHA